MKKSALFNKIQGMFMSGMGLIPLFIMIALWGNIIHTHVIDEPVFFWQWAVAVVYSIGAISYIVVNLKKK